MNGHIIPEELQDLRYGVVSHHDPEILERIQAQSPEHRFLEMVDHYVFRCSQAAWEGTARELNQELRRSECQAELEALKADSPIKIGAYLSSLISQRPDRVSKRILHGVTRYSITPPQVMAAAVPVTSVVGGGESMALAMEA